MNKELTETYTDITDKLASQNALIDSLNFYLNDDDISKDQILRKANGISIPSIKFNSWKAISNSKIELMDYEKVSTLAVIEEQKELLKIKSEKFMDFVYSNFRETAKDKKEFMRITISEIISTEISLQRDIKKMIDD